MREFPKEYDHITNEQKWGERWERWGIYRWNSNKSRAETFVVDTPPPTVSGSLHVGHVFSYTHTDLIVRYQRMLGKNIMYPMGWDDNGLPTERRVQNKFNIRCNPHLAYEPNWKPTEAPAESKGKRDETVEVSRKNFIEACAHVTKEDEAAFETLWRRLGLSLDWSQTYATIDPHCCRVSQLSFLDLVGKGLLYNAESPTMWDVDFQTALAQADLEDRTLPGAYHDLVFGVEGGGEFVISTTRPELLVSCVAVAAHPNDERYKKYFGKKAITPLFRAEVPIVAAEHADPEKGTGILMICTFGDVHDVEWWKSSGLPIKQVIGRDGRFVTVHFGEEPFTSIDPEGAQEFYNRVRGKNINQARKLIVELLDEKGSGFDGKGVALKGKPKPMEHPVKFYEKGDRPIEYVTTRQWFIKLLDHKPALIEQGRKINWHPAHMLSRYTNWVEGLNHDWCISRQRFFGVPFPVWYPVRADGTTDYANPIYAKAENLPVDPLSDVPAGFSETQRDKPNGFRGDPDVMDTWATSSLTPQLMSHWGIDNERHAKLFPMDIRPQSHEIIRTWAFYTILKGWMHSNEIPWKNVVISGWILDPDRKKMSKSKGNTVTPQHLLDEYSSDAVRYWAGRARLGVDTAFDDKVFKTGRKLVTKIFNASRFVLMQIQGAGAVPGVNEIKEPLDLALVEELRGVITAATEAFENFEYAVALQHTETAFWSFCDNYVELVKGRAYAESDPAASRSAIATLAWALKTFLRLFAPFTPYVTEEVWSCGFAIDENDSVHTSRWPNVSEVSAVAKPSSPDLLPAAIEVVNQIRHAKSQAEKSLKWPVESLEIVAHSKNELSSIRSVMGDILRVGRVLNPDSVMLSEGTVEEGRKFSVTVGLAETEGAEGTS